MYANQRLAAAHNADIRGSERRMQSIAVPRHPIPFPANPVRFAHLSLPVAAAIVLMLPAHAEHAMEIYECAGHATQAEVNGCSFESLRTAQDKLAALYRHQLGLLSAASLARLVESQERWLAFRDAACRYEVGPREESGTMWPHLRNRCLEHHTRQRIRDLTDYVRCTRDGCPH